MNCKKCGEELNITSVVSGVKDVVSKWKGGASGTSRDSYGNDIADGQVVSESEYKSFYYCSNEECEHYSLLKVLESRKEL